MGVLFVSMVPHATRRSARRRLPQQADAIVLTGAGAGADERRGKECGVEDVLVGVMESGTQKRVSIVFDPSPQSDERELVARADGRDPPALDIDLSVSISVLWELSTQFSILFQYSDISWIRTSALIAENVRKFVK